MASLVKTDKISTTAGGAQEFTLPAADGTANQHLKTDGSGVLGWASAPSITGSTNTWIPTITGADALAGTANFTYDGNTLDVKNSGTASSINLYCETNNAHYIKIKSGPHASATSYTLTMPNAPPSVAGQALTATTAGVASWATVGLDNTPSFMAYYSSSVSIATATTTAAVLDSEYWDTDSAYNVSDGKFTIPSGEAGKYMFTGSVEYSGLTIHDSIAILLLKNSSSVGGSWQQYGASRGGGNTLQVTYALDLAVADYVQLGLYQNSGGAKNAAANTTYLIGYKMIGV